MLLLAQVPLADARPFEREDVRRLPRPRFDLLFDPQSADFVRSFGPLRERALGLRIDWPFENLYCQAARAIRIDMAQLRALKRPSGGPGHLTPVIRRLLSDSKIVGRAELGLARVPPHPLREPMAGDDVERLLEDFAHMPVSCPRGDELVRTTVRTMGDVLADQILASTTRHSKAEAFTPKSWWVTAGRPLLMFQYAQQEVATLPGAATAVPVNSATMTLHHMTIGNELTWLIGLSPRTNMARLRELRLHLMRLHCEHQVAHIMVRHIAYRRLEATDDLEHYLERTSGLLHRTSFYGHTPSATLKIASQYMEQATAADRATLEHGLDSALSECRAAVRAGAKALTYPLL
jgi:hypothetical protein